MCVVFAVEKTGRAEINSTPSNFELTKTKSDFEISKVDALVIISAKHKQKNKAKNFIRPTLVLHQANTAVMFLQTLN